MRIAHSRHNIAIGLFRTAPDAAPPALAGLGSSKREMKRLARAVNRLAPHLRPVNRKERAWQKWCFLKTHRVPAATLRALWADWTAEFRSFQQQEVWLAHKAG